MSLRLQLPAQVPDDTACVARAAFPHGNTYLNLRDELGTVFDIIEEIASGAVHLVEEEALKEDRIFLGIGI